MQGIITRKIKYEECTVKFDDSEDIKNKVFEHIMNYYKEHEAFCGESIM